MKNNIKIKRHHICPKCGGKLYEYSSLFDVENVFICSECRETFLYSDLKNRYKFKSYKKISYTEMRPYDPDDEFLNMNKVSISKEDKENGSPKKGDMIARNIKNHNDMWLVSKEYFEKNYELIN